MSQAQSLFGFAYSTRALDFLRAIPLKIRKQIHTKINALATNALPPGSKLIRGASGDQERVYRIRSGDYRVLYVLRSNPSHVVILDIDHRKDIYK